jgi:hypothetical protein
MPQVLNISSKKLINKILVLGILLVGKSAFAQYIAKQTIEGKSTSTKTSDYYIYDRQANSYNGLSVSTGLFTQPSVKPAYQLNIVYTTSSSKANKISFTLLADTGKKISALLTDDGMQYNDNKSLNSYKYHIDLADSLLTSLNSSPIKTITLLNEQDQALITFDKIEPTFLLQQLQSIKNKVARKSVVKKSVKSKKKTGTRSY